MVSKSTAGLSGLASLLLLTWITVALRQGPIESDLETRVTLALESNAIDGLAVDVRGRDLYLAGELRLGITPGYVAGVAKDVWGVRTVDISGLVQRYSLPGAEDPFNVRLDPRRIARLGGDLSNPMDARTCQRTLARLAAAGSLRFEPGGASPLLASYRLLNDLAAVAYQCPETAIVIGGHTDAGGDPRANLRLSQARAEAVERFFHLAGIPAVRMRAIAYGDSRPIASNATPEGRVANRRITFDVLPKQ